jgi:hypothetical protein
VIGQTGEENILQEADRLIHGDRNKDYHHPLDDYTATAKIWSGILGPKLTADITPEEAMLCMVGMKMSRLSRNFNHRDSLVDMAGYAGCIEMSLKERERRDGRTIPSHGLGIDDVLSQATGAAS